MKKQIDFQIPIKQLADRYPDFVEIMVKLGFTKIQVPGMLNSVGRFVSLEKGCKAMNIDPAKVKATFIAHGYEVINND
ncbi:DUF1858 domain-containing protein [Lactobacillus sp. 3B(2020)]|uniref:DUF1858 domain-containing protein n=2 Tax=Lactobacillaceae TaxID=33958 RepID=UPI0015DDFE25|nr:DUF1858 domain-containing protein [Lactobacillus sp. 3B(2020)]QLL70033.1 DUF1858 domain-containing protein [Lactobacillus sp. 3B(2020)]